MSVLEMPVVSDARQADRSESENHTAKVGRSAPVGATVASGGVNFSLYSRDASGVELLLFESGR